MGLVTGTAPPLRKDAPDGDGRASVPRIVVGEPDRARSVAGLEPTVLPGTGAGVNRRPSPDEGYRLAVRIFSVTIIVFGVLMLVVTLARGGGPLAVGVLFGLLFIALGLGGCTSRPADDGGAAVLTRLLGIPFPMRPPPRRSGSRSTSPSGWSRTGAWASPR